MEKTINEVFENRVNKYQDRMAVEKRYGDQWVSVSFNEYYDRSRKAGLGLYGLGVRKGDRISIFSENRLEWLFTDMGALGIGAIVAPIYATVNKEEVAYILNDSHAKVIVVEEKEHLEKARYALNTIDSLEKIVLIEADGVPLNGDSELSFDDLLSQGEALHEKDSGLFQKLAGEVTPDDIATLQYTSGTTGHPKGAILTHGNIMANIRAIDAVEPPYGYETDNTIGFLPLSHVFERVPGHFFVIYKGVQKSYAGSIDTLVEDIQSKKPTVLFAVPRVLEKVYQKMNLTISEKPAAVQKLFAWAQDVGMEVSRYNEDGRPLPFGLKVKNKIAYKLVFHKLQENLGGRIRWICAAGAPIAKEIVSFFNAAGIFVLEGYGMTEVCGGATLSHLNDYCPGTVGRPIPGMDIKIADDGEILVKSDCLFKGYWNMADQNSKIFTDDGYFKTGDIGEFNDRGLLHITDRKKDLIITAGGKNIAPQKIESLFKVNPLFGQVLVIGDRRKYLTALFNLNYETAAQTAKEKNIPFHNPEELCENADFLKFIDKTVEEVNSQLARVETIKKYRIIKNEFSQETGELTVSLKLKKKVVMKKYNNLIEDMYADAN